MAELKPFEVIMRIAPIAGQNGKGEVVMQAEKVNEVVRCKDCKHYEGLSHLCRRFDEYGLTANDFCSRGENGRGGRMKPKTITSIVVVFRINGVKYGRRMNFETEVAEEHIGFTKTVLETLMRGMKSQAVIDDYKVYDEVRVLDEGEENDNVNSDTDTDDL